MGEMGRRPGLLANWQGQCSPERWRVSAEIHKEIYTSPLVASFPQTCKETHIQHRDLWHKEPAALCGCSVVPALACRVRTVIAGGPKEVTQGVDEEA